MTLRNSKLNFLPWKKIFIGSLLSLSATAFADNPVITVTTKEVSPTTDPFNAANCLPSIVPAGVTGVLQINTYQSGSIVSNPHHKHRLVNALGTDTIVLQGDFPFGAGLSPIAYTSDRGQTWKISLIPINPCSGGSLSLLGLVTSLAYNRNGKVLYAQGSYADSQTFDNKPFLGFGKFVSISNDDGATWSPALSISTTPSGLSENAEATVENGTGNIVGDYSIDDRAYFIWDRFEAPLAIYGNIYYTRTKDAGYHWSQPAIIYDMALDPLFIATRLNTNLPRAGGQSIAPSTISIPGSESGSSILLTTFFRYYPMQTATTYTQNLGGVVDTITDHAIIRSTDNGKNWTQAAIPLGNIYYASSYNPTTPASEGLLVFDNSFGSSLAYSPSSGRVYDVWQSSSVPPTATVPDGGPDLIQLVVSNDKGLTWTNPVKVNLTSTTVPSGNQAFDAAVAVTNNGFVGIAYYDYRNYDPASAPFIATDAWLAIYRETSSTTGGSTGVGLDFVQEIRLTPNSFDALIGYNSVYHTAAGFISITANGNDDFFISFNQTGSQGLPTSIIDGITVDPNNRLNAFVTDVDVETGH